VIESYIKKTLNKKDILIMTHVVLGYPSFEHNMKIIKAMVSAGVDLMELQIPCSNPTADGPVITRANQQALEAGATVIECLNLANKAAQMFTIPFLMMSYSSVVFRYGIENFVASLAGCGLNGCIIPDLSSDVRHTYLDAMYAHDLDPIHFYSPSTSLDQMRTISSFSRGFIYCIAREGLTGENTDFSDTLATYLRNCRQSSSLPLALGFGIKEKCHIDFLKGKADIAVIGSQTIRIMGKGGIAAVEDFIRGLR
jgi:tryptophan synthase alpha chain